jgi:cytochrome P450 PksS
MSKLRDNPALIKTAVEELLRYNGPLETATERYARTNTTVAGITVPRGDLVLAVLASANRDDRHFKHADRLDLEREPNPHVAFGLGIHYCLGASLARLEGQIAIATLLRRIPNLKVAIPSEALRWSTGTGITGSG